MLGDGTCQEECLTPACGNDKGDCVTLACSAECYAYMLEDGICQESCKVESCQWDRTDCDCSPGCSPPLLANAQCDRSCNTEACSYDNGECVGVLLDCGEGCSQSMIGDGRCDEACDRAECEWDGLDCGCAPDCNYEEIVECKPECLVLNCAYGDLPGHLPCNNPAQRLTQRYYDVFTLAKETAFPENRYDLREALCSVSTLENLLYKCVTWISYNEYCLYHLGTCNEPTDTCERQVKYGCLQCVPGLLNSRGICLPECITDFMPHPLVPDMCVPHPDLTTAVSPLTIYVNPQYTGSESDGSWQAPFLTIEDTINLWTFAHVRILLMGPLHFVGSSSPVDIPHSYDRQPRYLTIVPLECEGQTLCSRPTVLVSGSFVVGSERQRNLTIANVNFEENPSSSEQFPDFLRLGAGTLSFQNVSFENFHNFRLLITVRKSISIHLRNVNFTDIRMSVFALDKEPLDYYSSEIVNFTYETGQISYSSAATGPFAFLKIGRLHTVQIANVTFTGLQCAAECAFLSANSWLDVKMQDCLFANNNMGTGFFLSVNSTLWQFEVEKLPNILDIKPFLNKVSYSISNCVFRNNSFTTGSHFAFVYRELVQNIRFSNLRFFNECAALVSILNTKPIAKQRVHGSAYADSNGNRVSFSLAWVTFQAVQIVNCTSPQRALMYFRQLPYVMMNAEIAGYHIGQTACTPVIWAEQGYSYALVESRIESRRCGTGLLLSNYTGPVTLLNTHFSDLSLGSAADISTSQTIHLENVSVSHSVHQGCGVVSISGLATAPLKLIGSFFEQNSANEGGALCLNDLTEVIIHASEFHSNQATGGGAILLTASTKTPTSLIITECLFEGNQAEAQGGALYVYFDSAALYLHLAIEDSVFEGNQANSGAALYLSSRIQLQTPSHLSNVAIARNFAVQAAIFLAYQNGTLAMSSLRFEENAGELESCLHVLFSYSQGSHQNTILIADSVFVHNVGQYVVRFPYALTSSYLILSNSTLESNTGTALYLMNSQLKCTHSAVLSNNGSVLVLASLSKAELRDVTFEGNQAANSAAGIELVDQAFLYCVECVFRGNGEEEGHSTVQVESDSAVIMLHSVFHSNRAKDGSALKFILASPSSLRNCSFTANYAAVEGTVVLMFTDLTLNNCIFRQNTALQTAALVSIESNLTLVDCVLENQSGDRGYFVFATSLSSVNLANTRISQGAGQNSAIYVEESSIVLSFCQVTNMIGGKGALLYAYGNANVTFLHTHIAVSTALVSGLVYLWLSSGYFLSTHFSAYQGSAVVALQATVFLAHSTFRESSSDAGTGLRCLECVALTVQHCEFEGLKAGRAGAVELHGNAVGALMIEDCLFARNSAIEAGAIYAQDVKLHISKSGFTNNSAESPVFLSDFSAGTLGVGGAVVFLTDPSYSYFLSISDSHFIGNWADGKGGAIHWEGSSLPVLNGLVFAENAALYGVNISSFPVSITASPTVLPQSASGQSYSSALSFYLIDHYGQTVTSDSSTKAGLSIQGSNATVYGSIEVTAHQGHVVFDDFSIAAVPGTNVTVTAIVPGLTSLNQLTIYVRLCEPGESQFEQKCQICKAPKYSFNSQEPCKDCPLEAVCMSGANVYPKAGYWRYDWLSSAFMECPNTAACLGPEDFSAICEEDSSCLDKEWSSTGTCLEGYVGNMCQTCDINYHRTSKIWCQPCPPHSTSIATSIGYVLAVTFFCIFIVITSIKSARKPKSLHSVYLKQLMNYLQLVMLMGSFNLSWPTLMKEMLNIQDSAGSFSEHLLATDCLVDNFDESEAFYTKLILLSSAPIAFFAISSLCWLLVAAVKRSMSVVKRELVASGIILFFLLHPSVMRVMFSAFNCEEVRPGEYWVAGLLVRCWQGKHLTYALAVALPAIIIWGIAVPGTILAGLVASSKKLNDISVQIRYGFMVKGYSVTRYYWEFFITYRKLLIISIATFLSRIPKLMQALLALSVLVFSLTLQHHYQPYSHISLNTMEQCSLLVSIATIFFGLYYLDSSLSVGWEYFFFATTLGVNVYFLQYWLRKTTVAFFVLVVKQFTWLKQYFVVVNELSAIPYKLFRKRYSTRTMKRGTTTTSKSLYLLKLSKQ